jgi:hypothetical protein
MTAWDEIDLDSLQVGDLIPEALAELREAGARLGRQRATRAPKTSTPSKGPGKTGRPIRLHDGLIETVVRKIEDGCPIDAAAISSGIPTSTFHSWTKRGRDARAALDGGATPDVKDRIFMDFLDRTEAARSHALAQAVTAHQRLAFGGEVLEVIEDVESGRRTVRFSKADPKALEWYMERSHPAQFGTRRVEVSGPDGAPIGVEVEVSARELLRKRIEQVASRLGGEESAAEG